MQWQSKQAAFPENHTVFTLFSKSHKAPLVFQPDTDKNVHYSKVQDRIENYFFQFLDPYFQTIFVEEFWTAINLLSADIYYHKAGTKLPYKLALYLVCARFFSKSTTFDYAQPWWATVNPCQSGYGPNAINAPKSRKTCFLATS